MRQQISATHYVVGGGDTGSNEGDRRMAGIGKLVSALLGMLVVMYLVYGRVHILFYRTENCWLAMDVQQGMPAILRRIRYAFTTSYNGHYTPLFFCFQLACHSLFGIHEWIWRLCQLTIVAFLALAFLSLLGQVVEQITPSQTARFWIKLGLAAPFVFSPLMIDFVGWPFELSQLLWAAFTLLCVSWIGKAITNSVGGDVSIKQLGVALAFGYAAINCFGLGAATLAGWCAVWAVLMLDGVLRKASASFLKKLGGLGIVGIALTLFHGALMIIFLPKTASVAPHAALNLKSFVAHSLGLASNLLVDCLRSSLWSPDGWPFPRGDMLAKDWVYGLGGLLLLASCAVFWFVAYRARPSSAGLRRVCWQTFSLAAFVFYVLMEGLRVAKGEGVWENFLLGPRYLWPSALLLIGVIASFASLLRMENIRLAIVLALLVTASCIAGNMVYQSEVAPKVWPLSTLSHEDTWRELASMTSELRQAGLPLPDLPLEEMCAEFNPSLSRYELLLRSLSGTDPQARFDWLGVDKITPGIWGAMRGNSPALVRLAKRVFATQDTAMRQGAPATAAEQPRAGTGLALTSEAQLKNSVVEHVKDHPNLGVDIEVNGVKRQSIWIDPPTSLTFHDIQLGKHPMFRAFAAIHPHVWGEKGADGAVFQIDVIADGRAERVIEVDIDPFAHPEKKSWNFLSADLSKYAGRKVDLVISNSPGPKNNDYADWCIWGSPELTDE